MSDPYEMQQCIDNHAAKFSGAGDALTIPSEDYADIRKTRNSQFKTNLGQRGKRMPDGSLSNGPAAPGVEKQRAISLKPP